MKNQSRQSIAAKIRWQKAGKSGILAHIKKMNKVRIKKMRENKALLEKLLRNKKNTAK